MRDDPNYDLLAEQLVAQLGKETFIKSTHAIGLATYAAVDPSPLIRKVVHDIRGGALTVLIGYTTFLNRVPDRENVMVKAILMARDHAKLMRNAIYDLDPVVTRADESIKIHPIDDFVNKWRDSEFQVASKVVQIETVCTFVGNITNRCLETSAIDRILYNYINNAARFTADKRVRLSIFAVSNGLVRWVVQNRISETQQQWLADNVGDNLTRLFEGGITRGGHGLGLSSCTDFVAASFGLRTAEALKEGYLGAKLLGDQYCAWFHWPAYVSKNPAEPVCHCGDD
jgi:K+-sensing histidine kinase KdpD